MLGEDEFIFKCTVALVTLLYSNGINLNGLSTAQWSNSDSAAYNATSQTYFTRTTGTVILNVSASARNDSSNQDTTWSSVSSRTSVLGQASNSSEATGATLSGMESTASISPSATRRTVQLSATTQGRALSTNITAQLALSDIQRPTTKNANATSDMKRLADSGSPDTGADKNQADTLTQLATETRLSTSSSNQSSITVTNNLWIGDLGSASTLTEDQESTTDLFALDESSDTSHTTVDIITSASMASDLWETGTDHHDIGEWTAMKNDKVLETWSMNTNDEDLLSGYGEPVETNVTTDILDWSSSTPVTSNLMNEDSAGSDLRNCLSLVSSKFYESCVVSSALLSSSSKTSYLTSAYKILSGDSAAKLLGLTMPIGSVDSLKNLSSAQMSVCSLARQWAENNYSTCIHTAVTIVGLLQPTCLSGKPARQMHMLLDGMSHLAGTIATTCKDVPLSVMYPTCDALQEAMCQSRVSSLAGLAWKLGNSNLMDNACSEAIQQKQFSDCLLEATASNCTSGRDRFLKLVKDIDASFTTNTGSDLSTTAVICKSMRAACASDIIEYYSRKCLSGISTVFLPFLPMSSLSNKDDSTAVQTDSQQICKNTSAALMCLSETSVKTSCPDIVKVVRLMAQKYTIDCVSLPTDTAMKTSVLAWPTLYTAITSLFSLQKSSSSPQTIARTYNTSTLGKTSASTSSKSVWMSPETQNTGKSAATEKTYKVTSSMFNMTLKQNTSQLTSTTGSETTAVVDTAAGTAKTTATTATTAKTSTTVTTKTMPIAPTSSQAPLASPTQGPWGPADKLSLAIALKPSLFLISALFYLARKSFAGK